MRSLRRTTWLNSIRGGSGDDRDCSDCVAIAVRLYALRCLRRVAAVVVVGLSNDGQTMAAVQPRRAADRSSHHRRSSCGFRLALLQPPHHDANAVGVQGPARGLHLVKHRGGGQQHDDQTDARVDGEGGHERRGGVQVERVLEDNVHEVHFFIIGVLLADKKKLQPRGEGRTLVKMV